MNYQWYPGHMAKARKAMQEDLKLVDAIIELVDARIPYSSKNPDIDGMSRGKARVLLLNKADLADGERSARWKSWYEGRGYFVEFTNAKAGEGMKGVRDLVREACREKTERDLRRGIRNRPVRAMVVGVPNVGKSAFINSFAGRACVRTGNRPGVTKGKQWIRLNKDVELLDTPGILWPRFEDPSVGMRLALIGSIRDEILDQTELSLELIAFLEESYDGILENAYQTEAEGAPVAWLEAIARRRGCLRKGGEPDLEKAAALLLDDFKNGKVGRITLELPMATDKG